MVHMSDRSLVYPRGFDTLRRTYSCPSRPLILPSGWQVSVATVAARSSSRRVKIYQYSMMIIRTIYKPKRKSSFMIRWLTIITLPRSWCSFLCLEVSEDVPQQAPARGWRIKRAAAAATRKISWQTALQIGARTSPLAGLAEGLFHTGRWTTLQVLLLFVVLSTLHSISGKVLERYPSAGHTRDGIL